MTILGDFIGNSMYARNKEAMESADKGLSYTPEMEQRVKERLAAEGIKQQSLLKANEAKQLSTNLLIDLMLDSKLLNKLSFFKQQKENLLQKQGQNAKSYERYVDILREESGTSVSRDEIKTSQQQTINYTRLQI